MTDESRHSKSSELRSHQVISAKTTTKIDLDEVVVDQSQPYKIRAVAHLKTLGDGTRANLAAYVNGDEHARAWRLIASDAPTPRLEQVVRDYVFGSRMSEDELDRRVERAMQAEVAGAPQIEAIIHLNHTAMLEKGDKIDLRIFSEEQGKVVSGVTGLELVPGLDD